MWYTLPILEQYSRFAGVYNDVRCVMTYLKAILLGLVQGIAEFLPISSSGHLAIARNLLNMEGAGSIPEFFDVLLHLGTLIAVFAAYWSDIRDMVVEFFRGIGDLRITLISSILNMAGRVAAASVLVLLWKMEIEALPYSYVFGWVLMLAYELPAMLRYLRKNKM